MKAYILTTKFNEHNQYGEYFVAWFHNKPTREELKEVMDREGEDWSALFSHILKGGGRVGDEEQWYNLKEINSSNDIF